VGHEEVTPEIIASPLLHALDGQAGGVGGDESARPTVLLDLGEERLLDGEVLDDDLDDPVAL
jgi:hypothetical protein